MDANTFPVLSLIIFIPIIAGVLMLFLPKESKDLVRGLAIGAAATVFLLSLFVYLNYNARVDEFAQKQADVLTMAGRGAELAAFNLEAYTPELAQATRSTSARTA